MIRPRRLRPSQEIASQGPWAATVCLVVLSVAVSLAQEADPRLSDPRVGGTVAIVPLTNITGQTGDEWIGQGIAESLATDFQSQPTVTVVDRELVSQALGARPRAGSSQDEALRDVVRGVSADWLVSGGYQRNGDEIRIIARLVDVETGTSVVSAKVDGLLADLFTLQDQVSDRLISGLPVSLATSPPPGVASPDAVPANPVGSGDGGTPVARSPASIPSTTSGATALAMIDGPPPPLPPEVMNRDETGRTTVRAIRLSEPIRLDGQLDEQVYHTVPPITGFIQQVPVEGAPATERTEAWITFDATNVYVSARVHDSAPESEWIANEMRRDTNQLRQNDTFTAFFDTFYDRRNGVNFYTNPLGARADQQFTNEGNPNSDWNPVWDVRTGRFDGGWTVEMEIPFKTLRYRSGSPQVWGVQLRRSIRRKNEWAYLTRIPISAGGGSGSSGIFRVSAAGTLVGLEPPAAGRNIEVKPYAIGGATTDVAAGTTNEGDGDAGLDVKYGITQNLTADFTYKTDFAQVEVDEQQVNLTRFSLFFPEKREFFLEGRGIFGFARGGVGAGGPGGFGGDTPTLFYSRRIGLERGTVVPIYGGARMTGKVGPFDVGALSIQTEDSVEARTDSTNFTVLRIRRDILRRSSIGGILTNRSVSLIAPGSSQAYGVDGTFSFYDNLNFVTYFAKTRTPGRSGRDTSYQGKFEYGADRYGLTVDHILVEDNFIPEIGFVRRDNYRRTNLAARFSPRPQGIDRIRRFSFEAGVDYFNTADEGRLETRERTFDFSTEFENSDVLAVNVANAYELLEDPFEISSGILLPVGGYGFTTGSVAYSLGAQRTASGTIAVSAGSFWNGDIRTLEYRQGRINVLDQFSIEPTVSFNTVDLPQGSFNTTLVSSRFNYAFNPRMFLGALVQYNSSNEVWSNNFRLRWEYSPGSELFVVYTEDRDIETLRPDRFSELRNRGFVVKINRLFRL